MDSNTEYIKEKHSSLLEQIQTYRSLIPTNNIQAHTLLDFFQKELGSILTSFNEVGGVGVPKESPLTTRESEVLSLVAEGQPNKEIAWQLGISQKTVQYHLKSIFSKLEVSSRTEASTKALKLRIITL